ncbi:MAG TPA: MGMT family protein, partial [Rhabdochlamydiaceae bacterium]
MEVIAPKPGIRVQVQFKAGSLERISLFSSPEFSLDCPSAQIEPFRAWLKAYSQGQFIPFPLPLPCDTFQGHVLRFLKTIPWGSVCSYKDVAKAVSSPRA